MRVKILAMVVVLIALPTSILACTTTSGILVRVMKIAPEDASQVICLDINAIKEDPDFSKIGLSYSNIFSDFETLDMSAVSNYATIETDGFPIHVFMGDFNLENVRAAFKEQGFTEGEYLGEEFMTVRNEDDAVAFLGNMIVFSDDTDLVKACIHRYKEEEPSLYDNEDMRDVVNKLPAATVSVILAPMNLAVKILASGICVNNKMPDDDVLDVVGWFKLHSVASAEAALRDIEDELANSFDSTQLSGQLRGQFIEITGEIKIPGF